MLTLEISHDPLSFFYLTLHASEEAQGVRDRRQKHVDCEIFSLIESEF